MAKVPSRMEISSESPALGSEDGDGSRNETLGDGWPQAKVGVDGHVRAVEGCVALSYGAVSQNLWGRMRPLLLGILFPLLATTLAVSSDPFAPLSNITAIFLIVFGLVGAVVATVYARMCRNHTLLEVTNTRPGELGYEFWLQLFAFGVGPLVGLLSTVPLGHRVRGVVAPARSGVDQPGRVWEPGRP